MALAERHYGEQLDGDLVDEVWHALWGRNVSGLSSNPGGPITEMTFYLKEDGTVGCDEAPYDEIQAKGWTVMDASGELELTRWLWQDKIPKGEFSILGAYEDSMKSTMMAKVVANITHGKLEGEFYGQPKTVLWFGGEESWNKSIKPRLVAAGADVSRVKQIKPPPEQGRILDISDPEHVEMLRTAIKVYDAAFIVFDPMTSAMGARNVEKEEVLRDVLEPFIDAVCHTDGATVLAIKHFTKLESPDPSKLLGGNRAWSQIARSFLAIAVHPDDDKGQPRVARRVVGVHKGNMTGDRTPAMFRPVGVKLEIESKTVEVPTIEWLGESDYTPEEALRARLAAERRASKPEPRQTAEAWLRDFLMNAGPSTRTEVITTCAVERGDAAFSPASFDKAYRRITDAGDAGPRRLKGKEALWSLVGYQTVPHEDDGDDSNVPATPRL
ncbi:AAA family ATPase [Mycolicibacter terrae]|uniref:AAA family ATPase n=1 Tax=Mycolicibacter terrae TaxID=1788 RepID=A0ACD2ES16_9MYCO|nr:AAA family ATPase [Mycolicibacter terrae]RRR47859.1 AAA family ATPase [Mycolicibacter terrae]